MTVLYRATTRPPTSLARTPLPWTQLVQVADVIGVRAILVHALHDEARSFYAHFDFEPSPTDPLHLMLLIKDARALLGT